MKQYFTGFFTAVCLTASVFILMGSQNKNLGDIIVNSISVQNDGKEVVWLGRSGNGNGMLETYNANGKMNIFIGSGKGFGAGVGGVGFLSTYNADGKQTGYFGTGQYGGQLSTYNADGKETIYLGTGEGGGGHVSTNNADGKKSTYLGSGAEGAGFLSISKDDKQVARLQGFLTTFNEHGVQTGYFGTDKNNDGMITIMDRYGDLGWGQSGKQ